MVLTADVFQFFLKYRLWGKKKKQGMVGSWKKKESTYVWVLCFFWGDVCMGTVFLLGRCSKVNWNDGCSSVNILKTLNCSL